MRNLAQTNGVVKTTKTAQIRRLLHLSNEKIAAKTGFTRDFIRTVRQRTAAGGSPQQSRADHKFAKENPLYWESWQAKNRQRWNAYMRARNAKLRAAKQVRA